MTAIPTPAPVDAAPRPTTGHLGVRTVADLNVLVSELTVADLERIEVGLDLEQATSSLARYTAWLRRQVCAWTVVGLPAVSVAALDWPLASVRPQCLDVVGLILTDLRELSPGTRPGVVPSQPGHYLAPPGVMVAAALLCLDVARRCAPLLPGATALSASRTAQGTGTRYLARCADLADRAAGAEREIRDWGTLAAPEQVEHARTAARRFTARLADALDTGRRTGW